MTGVVEIFRLHPSGAGTTLIVLKALHDTSGSKFPVLGYTIPYAFGNILLTAWGPLLVSLMTG